MGKRILLADDSMTIQKLVEMAFVDTDHELICLSQGQEAWEKMGEFKPDVVLADAIMPVLDGYTLCERIKNSPEFSHIPVVLLTGRFQPFDEARATEVKIDSRMMKPFVQEQLVSLVEKLAAEAPDSPAGEPQEPSVPPLEEEPESLDLNSEEMFEDEDLEPIDGDFLEADSLDETENLDGLVASPAPIVDSNTTIRVDQNELRNYLKQNRLQEEEVVEEPSLEDDGLDLDVEDFGEEDDFLSEDDKVETLETDLEQAATEAENEVADNLIVDDLESIEEDELEELGLEDADEFLELEEEDHENEDPSGQWEDVLDQDDSSISEVEIRPDMLESSDEDEDTDPGLKWGEEEAEAEPVSSQEDELEWGDVDTDPEMAPPAAPAGELEDATIALDREEMDDILTTDPVEAVPTDLEEDLAQVDTGDLDQEEPETQGFANQENTFDPDFLEKDTLPLDDIEDVPDELELEEEDTIPMDEEAEPVQMETGDEPDITEPMEIQPEPLELDDEPLDDLELVDEMEGPLETEEGDFDLVEDDAIEELDETIALDTEGFASELDAELPDELDDEDVPELDLEEVDDSLDLDDAGDFEDEVHSLDLDEPPSEELGVVGLGEDTVPGGVAEDYGVESVESDLFEDLDEPLISDEDEEPLDFEESESGEVPAPELDEEPALELDEEPALVLEEEPMQEPVSEEPQESELVFEDEPIEEDETSLETEADDPVRPLDMDPFPVEAPTEELDDPIGDPLEDTLDDIVGATELELEPIEPAIPELTFEEEPAEPMDLDTAPTEPVEEMVLEDEPEDALELEEPTIEETTPEEPLFEEPVVEMVDEEDDEPEPVEELSESAIEEPEPEPEEVVMLEPEEVEPEPDLPTATPFPEPETSAVTSSEVDEDPSLPKGPVHLSEAQLERLSELVVERLVKNLSTNVVKEVAWEVVPALAEVMVERKIFEIENES